MTLAFYVTAVIGIVFELVIISCKFFKAPDKLITLLETIENPLVIIVIAVLAYFGYDAAVNL